MRPQWEAAQAGLRVFLEEDGDYAHFLESVEIDLAQKLRFECRSRGGSLVESVAFDRAAPSHPYILPGKTEVCAEPSARGVLSSVDGKCNSFVEILADMLSLLRVQYGQLFCRSEDTQAALDAVLDGEVLEKYMDKQQLTAEKLVGRPLKRFEELLEFVEALSKTLSEDGVDGAVNNDSDAGTEEKLNYAPQLIHIVQENKHYIHLAKADAREEKDLIALQTCFRGDGAEVFHDLSDNKLLLHGKSSCRKVVGLEMIQRLLPGLPEMIYTHCFQDGTFVCSKRQKSDSGDSFTILRCLHLKQNAAFLEFIPACVPMLEPHDTRVFLERRLGVPAMV
ncbi:hypothetical protein GQ600_18908 [Phytophthora cactorum]|nr:hypothetical protein GQ600_18908 [Phytophthora cactorum]